ncbi:MAG TPA: toll/interleukin-1 receptor domain-containing protein, partial [Burkholderiales bacterium]|nr:toll/interleukin-1 receptor domain-containing protein [Burkholderiales bacterium]
MSTIFLSYSSDQAETAARIELSLKEDGHAVFRDRTSLPPGESFDAQIRQAVAASDLFVFLITRNSVSAGHYTLTELKFAQEKWGNPSGHVLPVVLEAVPSEAIPAFLRAVTILKPIGNVTAEVAGEVARMSSPWRRTLRPRRLALVIVAASVLAGGTWLKMSVDAGAIVREGRLLAGSGDYAAAWSSFERAGFPASLWSEVREAQEQLAMDWLDHARSSQ